MRKITKTLLAASVAAAVMSVVQAYAQSIGYNSGDLLLNFRQWDGTSAGANNLTIDIGTMAKYQSSQQDVYVGKFDLSSIASGSMDNIQFSVVGGNKAGSGLSVKSWMWASEARNGGDNFNPSSQGTESAWVNRTGSSMEAARTSIDSIGNNAVVGGLSDGSLQSYHSFVGDGGNFNGLFVQGNVETSTGTGFGAGSSVTADMFYIDSRNGNGVSGAFTGTFTLNGDGSVYFNQTAAAAVPEPGTCGLLVGTALIVGFARRQNRKQS